MAIAHRFGRSSRRHFDSAAETGSSMIHCFLPRLAPLHIEADGRKQLWQETVRQVLAEKNKLEPAKKSACDRGHK
jgi:hypothetical protein